MVRILAKCFQRRLGFRSWSDEAMAFSLYDGVRRDRHDDIKIRWIQAGPEGIIREMRAFIRRASGRLLLLALASSWGCGSPGLGRAGQDPDPDDGLPPQQFAAAVAGDRGEADPLTASRGRRPYLAAPARRHRPAVLMRSSHLYRFGARAVAAGHAQGLPQRPDPDNGSSGRTGRQPTPTSRRPGTSTVRKAFDPHVWLDFGIDQRIVDRIAAELTRIDPAGGPTFAANAGR